MSWPDISVGEWITYLLVVFFGVFTILGTRIAWLQYRRPSTIISGGDWKVERNTSTSMRQVMRVVANVNFAPIRTSFEVAKARCEVRTRGQTADFPPTQAHVGELHQGSKPLLFIFTEPGPDSEFSYPDTRQVDVEVWIDLTDGSPFYERRQVSVGPDTVYLEGQYAPNRSFPFGMARFAYFSARKSALHAIRVNALTKLWRYLKNG